MAYFILRDYTGTGVSYSQHRRNRERFWKKKCRWVDRKGRNKQGRNGSKCSIDTERDSDTKRDTKIEIATGTDRPTDRQTDKQTFNH